MKCAGNRSSRRLSMSIAVTILSVLGVVVSTSAQTSPETAAKPLSDVATIDAYCKELDSFAKRNRNRALAFSKKIPPNQSGETLSGDWRKFKNVKDREAAFDSNYLYDVGDVWMRDGRVVIAEFEFGTSGDWSQNVTYYFRADGTLAKMRNVFGKFMGSTKIVKERIYNSAGKRLLTRLQCFELENGRRKKCTSGDSQYDADVYQRVQNLPLYTVLKVPLRKD